MAKKCRDCGFKANLKCTIYSDSEDLYFCKKCFDKAMVFWAPIQGALDEGRITEQQVFDAINKLKKK